MGRAIAGEEGGGSTIRFRVLGTLDLEGGPDPGAVLTSPALTGLLSYLALASPGGFLSRDSLLAMFWAERPERKARHSLNQALYRLRSALGEGLVVTRGADEVGLDPGRLECDAWDFHGPGDPEARLELYRDEVLAGFHLTGSRAFEEWLEGQRFRASKRAFDLARGLASEAKDSNPAMRARWLSRALEIRPYHQDSLRGLMGVLSELGDQAGAIREYERFCSRLKADLDMEPAPETRAALREVREGGRGAPPVPWAGPSPKSAAAPRSYALWLLLLIVATGLVGWALARPRPPEALPAPEPGPLSRVVVEDLRNRTGDDSFDEIATAAADWVSHRLVTSGVVEAVHHRGDPQPGSATIERARRLGAAFLVTGSIEATGDSIFYVAGIRDVAAGRILRSVSVGHPRNADVAPGLERLRERLTAELAAVADPDLPNWTLGALGPPTVEAYRLYLAGLNRFLDVESGRNPRPGLREAASYFRRASSGEEAFIAPLFWEMFALDALEDFEARDSIARVIADRGARLAPWERALLDAGRSQSAGDWGGEYRAFRRVVELAPGEEWELRLASAAMGLRRYREAAERLKALDPEVGWLARREAYWRVLSRALHLAGDHDEELAQAERYLDRYPQSLTAHVQKTLALAGLGRGPEAVAFLREYARSEDPTVFGRMTEWLMTELRVHGQSSVADALVAAYLTTFDGLSTVDQLDGSFGVLVMGGRFDDAQRGSEVRLLSEDPTVRLAAMGELGYLAALRGDGEEARAFIDRLDSSSDASPALRTFLMAVVAANLAEPERAVGLLRASYRAGWDTPVQAHTNQALDPIRDHPGFVEFMQPRE